jgi:hypothetical protein
MPRCCTGAWITARRCWWGSRSSWRRLWVWPVCRPRFLPHGGFRPDAPACARALRNAHRKDRVIFADIENEIRQVIPPGEIDDIIDNIGIPRRFQPGIRRQPHLGGRRRHSDLAQARGARFHGGVHRPAAQAAAREIPGRGVLLRSGQHHQPDSELRTARAHRRAGGGPQRRRQLPDRATAADADRRIPGRRRAHSPGGGLPGNRYQRGPQQGRQVGLTQRT